MIYTASDHAGLALKQKIVEFLEKEKLAVEDLGPVEFIPDDDYPDYISKLALKMAVDKTAKGVIICRNGVGVSIMANRYKHLHCALSWEPKHAVSSRKDDNTNVLALPADYVTDTMALEILMAWLATPYTGEPRHERRLKKMESYIK